jgi:GT2 family glycosyltransferase
MNRPTMPVRFLFCVVTHNSAHVISPCLQSLAPLLTDKDRVVVVDNASTDETVSQARLSAPGVAIIRQPNLGFGRANNTAFEAFSSQFFVLVNPDIEVEALDLDAVETCFDENPEIVSITGDLHFPNGTRQYVHKRFPSLDVLFLRRFRLPLFGRIPPIHRRLERYEMRDMDFGQAFRIPCASGAFQILHRKRLPLGPLFDPRFFLYFEDTDLSRRLWEIGETRFLPWIRVCHRWDRGSHRSLQMLCFHFMSMVKYFLKWGLGNPETHGHIARN